MSARMSPTRVAATAVVAVMALSSCSSVSTGPDQVALKYDAGGLSSKTFQECIPVSTRQNNFDPSLDYYVYPANQRVYDFTGAKGADAGKIEIGTKDVIQMSVPGIVRFTLNTDCKALREFHEKIGNREGAYFNEASDPSKGWRTVLDQYIGRQIDATLDREALAYNWREIYTKPEVKEALDKAVAESLQELVDDATEGETRFFNILSVQLQKPEPPKELLDALAGEQTKVANANAAKAEAEAQIATAEAQARLATQNAQRLQNEIKGYGSADAYNKAKAIEKGINPYQPTYVVPQAGG